MSMKKLIFLVAAILCLAGCNQNAPTTYDKVAGHTYVRQHDSYYTDTIVFYNDGSLKIMWDNATHYEQIDQIVIVEGNNLRLFYEAFDKKIVNWDKREFYYRID